MKKISLILSVFFISLILSSCSKEGCTDSTATNYDSKAKKNDGSCKYENNKTVDPDKININSESQYYYKLDGKIRSGIDGENNITTSVGHRAGVGLDTIYNCIWNSSIYIDSRPIKTMLEVHNGIYTFAREDFSNEKFVDFFAKGKHPFANSDDQGIVIEIQDDSGNIYISNEGDQTGSTFEIIENKLVETNTSFTYVKVYAKFNCIVYNKNNPSDKKTITEGVYVNHFEKSF
jgi:hypothetical protein